MAKFIISNLKKVFKRIKLIYVARILSLFYALFLGIFALDTPLGLGFFIHLLPTIIFLGTLILTWRKPQLAGILFILEGIGTIIVFNTYRDFFVLVVISFVPILIGILFCLSKANKLKRYIK
jgi:nicotinamide riboside transporter PnuC